jgi:hypothetical protein
MRITFTMKLFYKSKLYVKSNLIKKNITFTITLCDNLKLHELFQKIT